MCVIPATQTGCPAVITAKSPSTKSPASTECLAAISIEMNFLLVITVCAVGEIQAGDTHTA
jgi:hypothetical protein